MLGIGSIMNWILHRFLERVNKWGVLFRALVHAREGEEVEGERGRPMTVSTEQDSRLSSSDLVNIDIPRATITSPDYNLHAIDIRTLKPGSVSPLLPPSI